MARVAYEAAKSASRIVRTKEAHDNLLSEIHCAQAHALAIRTRAEMRLAEEYDDAQFRGEVQRHGGDKSKLADDKVAPSAANLGLRHDEIHQARKLRDAEKAEPGIIEALWILADPCVDASREARSVWTI